MSDAQLDAIALLKADHRKVEELFEKFLGAKGADRKQGFVKQICTELTLHTTIEEEIFYPACKAQIKDDIVNEAYVEHDSAKMLMAELEAGNPHDEFYDAKVSVLAEQIKHHVQEEEKRSEGLFSQARSAGLDLDDLAARMTARKQDLLTQIKANGLPLPETRTMTGQHPDLGSPVIQAV